jgi:tryptophan synthase alpha chain
MTKQSNKLDDLFRHKKNGILNMYCTAGFPKLESTSTVLLSLQSAGTDIIEIGIPYSDPVADGPTIQKSNMTALENGMSIPVLFKQLNEIKNELFIPTVLMGYLNPVLQYGIENFCKDASAAGVAGIILPDLPMNEYERDFAKLFLKHNLHFIFLVTPETSDERIRKADKLSKGFLYAVSSSSTTGTDSSLAMQAAYFNRLKSMNLKNPVLIGFGIKDHDTFEMACSYSNGAIIGSAYINALASGDDIGGITSHFISHVKHNHV